MNAAELHQHYADVRRRITGEKKRAVCPPKRPVEDGPRDNERAVTRNLTAGMPSMLDNLRPSIVSMLVAYRVPWMAVVGRGRTRQVCDCRRAIIWILHLRKWSTTRIGAFIGQKDHSSVVHALNKINSRREKIDPYLTKAQANKARRSVLRKGGG